MVAFSAYLLPSPGPDYVVHQNRRQALCPLNIFAAGRPVLLLVPADAVHWENFWHSLETANRTLPVNLMG